MRDIYSYLDADLMIGPIAIEADNTPAAFDLKGFRSALIVLAVGAGGITFTETNKIEFKLTHSDDNATYEAVTADDLLGVDSVGEGGIVKALTAAHAAATVDRIGYIGNRRYLKLLADFGGTHTDNPTPITAVLIKGTPGMAPVA